MSETTEIKKLVENAHRNQFAVTSLPDGRTFVALPNGEFSFAFQDISIPNAVDVKMPKNVHQQVSLATSGSLIEYAEIFKNADSVLFANIEANVISCAIDYHAPAGTPDTEPCIARLGVHTATLTLPFSKEWQTWTQSNERLMEHVAFATFLEENALDVFDPTGADLLELCRDLQIRSDSNFTASVRMGDKVSFSYKKDDNAVTKDDLELPVEFTLAIPVYFNEPPVQVRCLMRRKITDGDLFLGYKMVRAENTRQAEFQRIASRIGFDTKLTVFYGKR
jgi:uncharacterized protein YfdQ (DUF2303 family)